MKIRFSNKRPEVGVWTITLASAEMFEYGSSGLGWRWARFGVFKLMEEITEGQYIKSADYKGFILTWQYWFPIRRGI